MRIIGVILFIAGLIGVIVFGVQTMNNSESFNFLGIDIAVSTANWTPLIVSAVVLVIGVLIASFSKRKTA